MLTSKCENPLFMLAILNVCFWYHFQIRWRTTQHRCRSSMLVRACSDLSGYMPAYSWKEVNFICRLCTSLSYTYLANLHVWVCWLWKQKTKLLTQILLTFSRGQSLSPYAISISTQTLKKKVWMCSVVCYRVCLPKCLDSNVPGNALCYFLLSLWSSTTISSFARISWLRFVSTDGECYMCTSHHQQGDTYLSVFVSPTSVCYIFRNWKPVKAYCSIFSLLSFLHLYCWFTVFCFVFFTLVLAKCNHHMRIYKFSAGAEQLSAPKQQKHRDIAADSFTILL